MSTLITDIFYRIVESHELHTLLTCMLHLLDARGHLRLTAAVDHNGTLRTHAASRADRIHSRVTTADYCRYAPMRHRSVMSGTSGTHEVDTRQVLIARHHPYKIFSGNTHETWQSGTGGDKKSAETHTEQIIVADSLAYNAIAHKHYTGSLKRTDFIVDHSIRQTELRNTVFQHTADLVKSLENGHIITACRNITGKRESCRT